MLPLDQSNGWSGMILERHLCDEATYTSVWMSWIASIAGRREVDAIQEAKAAHLFITLDKYGKRIPVGANVKVRGQGRGHATC